MTYRIAALALAASTLSACVTVHTPAVPSGDSCKAAPAQVHLGHVATAELGAELLRLTGSRELRWVPPGMMVTMDYKFGRLTVGYDEAMRITSIACG